MRVVGTMANVLMGMVTCEIVLTKYVWWGQCRYLVNV